MTLTASWRLAALLLLFSSLLISGSAALGRALPDEGLIAFESTRDGHYGIYLLDLRRMRLHPLQAGEDSTFRPAWSPVGWRIAYAASRNGRTELYVLDLDSGTPPRRLTNNRLNEDEFAWSPDGREIVFVGFDGTAQEIYIVEVGSGVIRQLTRGYLNYTPAWSPDGTRIAFRSNRVGPNGQIYTMSAVDGRDVRMVTTHSASAAPLAWSPDGTRIAYERVGDDRSFVAVSDVTTAQRVLWVGSGRLSGFPDWSPDGRALLYLSVADDAFEVYSLDMARPHAPRNLSQHHADDVNAVWSPDSRRIAFVSRRDGNNEVYVMDADGGNVRRLTHHPAQDTFPVWRP